MKRPLLWFVAVLLVAGLFMWATSSSKAADNKVAFSLVQAEAVAVIDARISYVRAELSRLREQQECIAVAVDLKSMARCGPLPKRPREP